METKVVNLREESYDVYIGRPGKGLDGFFGNHHLIGMCPVCGIVHTRDESIAAFKKDFLRWVEESPEYRAEVMKLKGKVLGCFCAPRNCHGYVIKEFLDKSPN
jgi:hypothetical protein